MSGPELEIPPTYLIVTAPPITASFPTRSPLGGAILSMAAATVLHLPPTDGYVHIGDSPRPKMDGRRPSSAKRKRNRKKRGWR